MAEGVGVETAPGIVTGGSPLTDLDGVDAGLAQKLWCIDSRLTTIASLAELAQVRPHKFKYIQRYLPEANIDGLVATALQYLGRDASLATPTPTPTRPAWDEPATPESREQSIPLSPRTAELVERYKAVVRDEYAGDFFSLSWTTGIQHLRVLSDEAVATLTEHKWNTLPLVAGLKESEIELVAVVVPNIVDAIRDANVLCGIIHTIEQRAAVGDFKYRRLPPRGVAPVKDVPLYASPFDQRHNLRSHGSLIDSNPFHPGSSWQHANKRPRVEGGQQMGVYDFHTDQFGDGSGDDTASCGSGEENSRVVPTSTFIPNICSKCKRKPCVCTRRGNDRINSSPTNEWSSIMGDMGTRMDREFPHPLAFDGLPDNYDEEAMIRQAIADSLNESNNVNNNNNNNNNAGGGNEGDDELEPGEITPSGQSTPLFAEENTFPQEGVRPDSPPLYPLLATDNLTPSDFKSCGDINFQLVSGVTPNMSEFLQSAGVKMDVQSVLRALTEQQNLYTLLCDTDPTHFPVVYTRLVTIKNEVEASQGWDSESVGRLLRAVSECGNDWHTIAESMHPYEAAVCEEKYADLVRRGVAPEPSTAVGRIAHFCAATGQRATYIVNSNGTHAEAHLSLAGSRYGPTEGRTPQEAREAVSTLAIDHGVLGGDSSEDELFQAQDFEGEGDDMLSFYVRDEYLTPQARRQLGGDSSVRVLRAIDDVAAEVLSDLTPPILTLQDLCQPLTDEQARTIERGCSEDPQALQEAAETVVVLLISAAD